MDNVAILIAAVVAYHLLIRLKGLLILQSAQHLVGREKVLYGSLPGTAGLAFNSTAHELC